MRKKSVTILNTLSLTNMYISVCIVLRPTNPASSKVYYTVLTRAQLYIINYERRSDYTIDYAVGFMFVNYLFAGFKLLSLLHSNLSPPLLPI